MPAARRGRSKRAFNSAGVDAQHSQRTGPESSPAAPETTTAEEQTTQGVSKSAIRNAARQPFAEFVTKIVLETWRKPKEYQHPSTIACAIVTVLPDYSAVPTSEITPSMVSVTRLEQSVADIPILASWTQTQRSHVEAGTPSDHWIKWKWQGVFDKVKSTMPADAPSTQPAPTTRSVAVALWPEYEGMSDRGLTAGMLAVWLHEPGIEPLSSSYPEYSTDVAAKGMEYGNDDDGEFDFVSDGE